MKLGKTIRAGLLGLGLAMAVVPTTGCKAMKEGLENAMAVSEDVEKELGVSAGVKINVNNGKQTVEVTLNDTPDGDAKEIKEKVTKIVKERIPDTDEVVVNM